MGSMNNEVLIAVAGAGKTERVASDIAAEEHPAKVFLLTYLTRNQVEDSVRVATKMTKGNEFPRIMGWMSFLLNEIVRPYSRGVFPDVRVGTLCTDVPHDFNYRSGAKRYFTKSGDVFSERLALLAVETIKKCNGAPIARLESVVDAIYIDEAQDLRGNDLCIIEYLMKSRIRVQIVCDPRQSVVSTNNSDRKHKGYRGVNLAKFFLKLQSQSLCRVMGMWETHRFTQEIANLSDAVFAEYDQFQPTVSNVLPEADSGIFFIKKSDVQTYAANHDATVLRLDKRAGDYPGVEVANFGECKGMTRRGVVIVATGPIEKFFKCGTGLKEKAACKLYVAITRAQQVVTIAVNDPCFVVNLSQDSNSYWHSFNFRLA